MSRLDNQHVVVTGGTGVLGAAVVNALVGAGAHCHIPAIETAPPTEGLPKERVSVTPGVDISNEDAVAKFYAGLPPLRGVVNIAGGFVWAPIADTSASVLQAQLSMNFLSCALSCREAVSNFRKAGRGGHIINIAARPALNPRQGANMTAYTASKAAVAAFTVALAEEVKLENIAVIALCPSIIDTPANRASMPDADHKLWVTPAAIAEMIVAQLGLADPVNSGALIPIYGGV